MKETLSTYFASLEDPRSKRNQRHDFMTLIGTSLLATLSGIHSFSGIQDFVEMHMDDLKKYFDFRHGLPSHDTYQRLWDALSPTQFQACFMDFIKSLETVASEVLSIDGKTIRNSGKEKALHIVSAWCHNNKLVFGQEKVDAKSNEIKAIPKLLDLLELDQKIITIDAMGCQRDICQKIIDKNGDYLISLKGNQGTLHDDVGLYLKDPSNHELINENNDKGHGRIEQRVAAVAHNIDWLQEVHSWPGLKSIGQITATVWRKGKETTETRFYISSLALTAQQLNEVARAHWGIENQLHWVLDVTFNEDKACIRNVNAAENLDILRKWALSVLVKLKEKPEQSIKSVMRKNAMSFKYLIKSVKKILRACPSKFKQYSLIKFNR
ncbi:MAG: ISAs1 family transposase [Alphaproteobacteria bacterium]|nr:ISAs1 family transposase [Alphaproteobacteria bacterium]